MSRKTILLSLLLLLITVIKGFHDLASASVSTMMAKGLISLRLIIAFEHFLKWYIFMPKGKNLWDREYFIWFSFVTNIIFMSNNIIAQKL